MASCVADVNLSSALRALLLTFAHVLQHDSLSAFLEGWQPKAMTYQMTLQSTTALHLEETTVPTPKQMQAVKR